MLSKDGQKKSYSINYVSYSSLYTFEHCKRQFKYQYLDRLPRIVKKHMSTIFGIAMHDAISRFYKNATFKLDELKWLFFDEFINCIRKEKIDFIKDPLDIHLKRANNMIERFYEKQKNDGQLKLAEMIEQAFTIYSSKLDIKIGGRIDLGIDNQIIDFKTEKKPNYKNSLKSLQLVIYALAYRRLKKKKTTGVCYYFLETGKKLFTSLGKDDYMRLFLAIKKLKDFVATAKNKDYIRNNKNCFFCEYKEQCRTDGK